MKKAEQCHAPRLARAVLPKPDSIQERSIRLSCATYVRYAKHSLRTTPYACFADHARVHILHEADSVDISEASSIFETKHLLTPVVQHTSNSNYPFICNTIHTFCATYTRKSLLGQSVYSMPCYAHKKDFANASALNVCALYLFVISDFVFFLFLFSSNKSIP